jgi:hypothetical protein
MFCLGHSYLYLPFLTEMLRGLVVLVRASPSITPDGITELSYIYGVPVQVCYLHERSYFGAA